MCITCSVEDWSSLLIISQHHLTGKYNCALYKLDSLLPLRVSILARVADYYSSLDVPPDWLSCTSHEIKEILRDKQLTSSTSYIIGCKTIAWQVFHFIAIQWD